MTVQEMTPQHRLALLLALGAERERLNRMPQQAQMEMWARLRPPPKWCAAKALLPELKGDIDAILILLKELEAVGLIVLVEGWTASFGPAPTASAIYRLSDLGHEAARLIHEDPGLATFTVSDEDLPIGA